MAQFNAKRTTTLGGKNLHWFDKVNKKYGAKARNMHSKPNAVTVIKGFIVLGTFLAYSG